MSPPARAGGACTLPACAAACLTAACAVIAVSPVPAQAAAGAAGHTAKRCGILAKGSRDYRIKARRVRCRFARRWARAYLRRADEPAGFDCYRPGTDVVLYCAKGARAYWAERLGAAAAAHPGHGPERVGVGRLAFAPADVTVGTGDTVLWIWTGPDVDHTVTADPGQAESFDSDPDGTPSRSQGARSRIASRAPAASRTSAGGTPTS